ncbi:MAG: hypothetical protein EWV49_13375 [Microcystis aeruginosa Ma_QC_Ch_20071001_S25]|uniref:Uncharacterized protein n=2 Tax=Microcystis aeruginosa TaxID=1126 RepID=A0A552FGJ8_MICAE|nr:MAG: hypothetical protein EWV84_06920 [Microcystis sp. M_QC_C_20170808_M3Col]TRU45843.1 MAG: hypothetical protein EWV91_13980 [Microcystis aeruginosa Ma_QC_Ca_00000000_S207]TRU48373.1 MAG: hypothetical protein EWV49_13375 [Microcystis aeruginosa Ma_QC_Ch_20071001_S25]TRU50651.1 MAG: hypothetical protein EWV57_09995 [Microcystis aeruginosa Ma_QC_Ch_20071001_S25D]TRU57671.1 MAG: hypothetical protein EWV90_20305 [Microcystis aeruginosa Ma_QC_Ch_20071001_M135]
MQESGVSPDEKIFTPTDERSFLPHTLHPTSPSPHTPHPVPQSINYFPGIKPRRFSPVVEDCKN